MAYRIGIDAGSKTIKVVIVDDTGKIVHSIYRRHRFDIKTTVGEAVHDLVWRYGDIEGTIGVTGSAGIGLATVLDLPFVQEVVATTRAVKETYPQADAIIELGGEDAKIVYLTGRLEQRMNATCAGGTGGFIDTIAFRIGAQSRDMSNLALRANHVYPIASRCAVFAETDVRPLLNAGAKTADIAASALEAVVRQTIGGLACGRPIEGTVVFLGGPLEHIPDLVRRFRNALRLTAKTGIKPTDAHLFTALGAAVCCSEGEGARTVSLADLEARIARAPNPENDLPRLDPLFESEAEAESFRARHANPGMKRIRTFDANGPLYLGIDAGSTAVKLVAITDADEIAYSDYRPTEGDALATTLKMVDQLLVDLPKTYGGDPLAHIAHATATGYGENLLRAALGIDSGIVETTAHTAAALHVAPDLTFLLDIGGQDIKAIWVRDGIVEEAVLNEACSSGCGSFIEGTAHSLRSTPERFAAAALSAREPIDLGTKCTVFMTSRIRHAQKAGASLGDLAAGAAYAVVRNALFRIIGVENLDSLGDRIVVQGGAFASDAVLRAFEKISGREVLRPANARLMGAIGAAIVARDRAHRIARETGAGPRSSVVSRKEIAAFKPVRRCLRCPGCANSCELSLVSFGNGTSYLDGNRCERATEAIGLGGDARVASNRTLASGGARRRRAGSPPNVIALEQGLLARFQSTDGDARRGGAYVGILDTLQLYDHLPFWHTLVTELGFSVLVPAPLRTADSPQQLTEGIDTIPSESACYPAKLSHVRLAALVRAGATAILAPRFVRGRKCPVTCEYPEVLRECSPAFEDGSVAFCSPALSTARLERSPIDPADREAIFECLAAIAPDSAPLSYGELDAALDTAVRAQRAFRDALTRGNDRALAWAERPGNHGIVIGGRPYHVDPDVIHGIDEVLTDLGFSVLTGEAMDPPPASAPGDAPWRAAKHAARLAQFAIDHPAVDLVYLQSFGCAYEALSIPDARSMLREAGRPLTTLKIDDIVDTAHLRIRLRTLAETIERSGDRTIGSRAPRTPSQAARVALPAPPDLVDAAQAGDLRAFAGFCQADIDTARMHVNDVCYVVAALAGRAIRIAAAAPELQRLVMPTVCTDCLTDGVARIVERALGRAVAIEWKEPAAAPAEANGANRRASKPADPSAAARAETHSRPLIGLVGAEPLVFDAFLNDGLVAFIERSGCDVALPDPTLLAVEDVRYLDQLDRLAAMGADHVIYLVSFGCLKGHVRARGAARALERRYPAMPITIIDYDPEASALNRENRIRLALESAREHCSSTK